MRCIVPQLGNPVDHERLAGRQAQDVGVPRCPSLPRHPGRLPAFSSECPLSWTRGTHRGHRRDRGGPGGARGGHRRRGGRPVLRARGEGRARELDLPLPPRDDLLHHPGAPRDRRPAPGHALREADAAGGPEVLPPRRRHVRAEGGPGGGGRGGREGGRHLPGDHGPRRRRPRGPGGEAAPGAQRRLRHRLLRPPQPPRHPRRGPAPRLPLLRRAPPVLSEAGGGGGRQELRGDRRPRALPGRGDGDPGAPARHPVRPHQVLDPPRHREPDQGGLDRGALRDHRRPRSPPSTWWSRAPTGREEIGADAVFLLTGYHPDPKLLEGLGVRVDAEALQPEHDPETFETNVPGVYLAGSIVSGRNTNRTFIETGRFHGAAVVKSILARTLHPSGCQRPGCAPSSPSTSSRVARKRSTSSAPKTSGGRSFSTLWWGPSVPVRTPRSRRRSTT